MRTPITLTLGLLGAFSCVGQAQQINSPKDVRLQEQVQIPGTELKPGSYRFSVEDTLQDRAIVRIADGNGSKYTLVLAVPNARLPQDGQDGLIFFDTSKSDKHVLRGWACPGCAAPLEFVYPKLQAAGITGITNEPVIAVDPSYDKLPADLSPDDMKVVTLWLLTPKPITARDKTKGVVAAKYVPAAAASPSAVDAQTTGAATSNPDVSNTSTTATATLRRTRLPKTASNTFDMILAGLILMLLGGVLHFASKRALVR